MVPMGSGGTGKNFVIAKIQPSVRNSSHTFATCYVLGSSGHEEYTPMHYTSELPLVMIHVVVFDILLFIIKTTLIPIVSQLQLVKEDGRLLHVA